MTEQGARPGRPGSAGTGGKGPDGAASARLWLRLFLLALLGGILTSSLMLPWKVIALVLALVALVVGVVALVKAIRAGLPRLVVLATSLGLAAGLLLAAGMGASVLLWPVTQSYEDCMSRALTLQAQRQCEEELRNLGGFMPGGSQG